KGAKKEGHRGCQLKPPERNRSFHRGRILARSVTEATLIRGGCPPKPRSWQPLRTGTKMSWFPPAGSLFRARRPWPELEIRPPVSAVRRQRKLPKQSTLPLAPENEPTRAGSPHHCPPPRLVARAVQSGDESSTNKTRGSRAPAAPARCHSAARWSLSDPR